MSLLRLAAQYRENAELCRARAEKLRSQLPFLGRSERYQIINRIIMLETISGESMATAYHLEHYYDHKEKP